MVITSVVKTKKNKASLSMEGLISRYELSNKAAVKSPKTILWYNEMLGAFTLFLEKEFSASSLAFFNIDKARDYVIHLKGKAKFSGHPYTPVQTATLSPKTVQGHVRALKAFSSWLHAEGYTTGKSR